MTARSVRTTIIRRALGVALVALATLPAFVAAQATGRIVGRVVDAQTGAGLQGVQVQVSEAQTGVLTALDGRYTIERVPAGSASLRIESLGYAAKIVTGVMVPPGGAVEQNVSLEPQAVALQAIEVTAGAERGSVSRALDQQRTSANIVNAITSEQIARSPDGDAAAAMQRVSGVTVQDNKFVFVRGLGERYTTTSLNGARIPSPEPERKVVPLDLFPSGLLQTITTSKTFTPDQSGDFSGAQVDIRTREFPAERQLTLSASFGYNDLAFGKTVVGAPTVGSEWLGFAGSERSLPAVIAAAGDFSTQPSQEQINRMVAALRNTWSAEARDGTPNGSFGVSLGGTDPLFGHDFSYLVSGTYSRSQDVRAGQVRAYARPGAEPGSTLETDRYEGSTGSSSILWGGLLNLSTLLGEKSRIAFNGTLNRTADNEARFEVGTSENHGELPLHVTRLRFVERSVFSGQLQGDHALAPRHRVDWSLTGSGVHRAEPDRSEIVYAEQIDPATGALLPPAWFSGSNEGAVRTFADLDENSFEAAASYRWEFGDAGRPHNVKFGATLRATDRHAESRVYSVSTSALGQSDRQQEPESIFDGRFAGDGDRVFRITPLGQGGSYAAEDRLAAGFAMAEFGFADRFRLIGGARIENSRISVEATPTIGASFLAQPEYTDVLPALSLNVELTDNQNLRFSATQTLARPEYRELAPIQFREVIGGEQVQGNADLRRTRILNGDVRWEWYPNAGEVLSIAAFAKSFDDPIERIYLATSGTRVVTFVNADGAENYGIELELRKRLGNWFEALEPLSVFTNATVMRSEIRVGNDDISARTSDSRPMVGQAPYVVNAGVTYASATGDRSATLLYNVVGERIVNAAEAPLPDVYEAPRHVLDLSVRFGLSSGVSAKLDTKNLLDAPYEITQGSVLRERFRTGRVFSVGLSWRP